MILFRLLRRPKLLYLHGMDEEIKYPGGGTIFNTLKKHFNIEISMYSSDPIQGLIDFQNIDFSKYSAVIGFSLGGLYASNQDSIPAILINPGFGVSQALPEYKKIDTDWKKKDHSKILKIFLSEKDKYAAGYLPEIRKEKLGDRIQWIPSQKHVPTEEELEKYIIPEIKKILGEI